MSTFGAVEACMVLQVWIHHLLIGTAGGWTEYRNLLVHERRVSRIGPYGKPVVSLLNSKLRLITPTNIIRQLPRLSIDRFPSSKQTSQVWQGRLSYRCPPKETLQSV
jgi:hypothetical protein